MVSIRASELAAVCGGVVVRDSGECLSGASIDSRTLQPGNVFFALKGENFDGHDFIDEAFNRGAAAAVVDRNEAATRGGTVILVENTLAALQKLAEWWRGKFDIPVVAVTGSSGKTTTKDILASLLSAVAKVHFNTGNHNNEIGVPLTLLGLTKDHEVCVLEMGMRGLGEIAELCSIARPTAGIITNVGSTHFERLGSMRNIALAKGELAESLPKEGFIMLNGENEWSPFIRDRSLARSVFFGFGADAQVRALEVEFFPEYTEFSLKAFGMSRRLRLPLWGKHNVYNCLAAAGAYLLLGFPEEKLQEGLDNLTVTAMRLERVEGINGSTIINDTYNANPDSVISSLGVLRQIEGRRRLVVLGDMFELGSIAKAEHRRVGEAVARLKPDLLVTVGDLSRYIGEEAFARGMDKNKIFHRAGVEEAVEILEKYIDMGDVVLVKGSRGMRMERIVSGLQSKVENHV